MAVVALTIHFCSRFLHHPLTLEATQVYRTYHNVDQAIKILIIEYFDDVYLNALSDEIMGYANCTSLQLLTHLLTYYAMIAPTRY
jgi:hypothetical protein